MVFIIVLILELYNLHISKKYPLDVALQYGIQYYMHITQIHQHIQAFLFHTWFVASINCSEELLEADCDHYAANSLLESLGWTINRVSSPFLG